MLCIRRKWRRRLSNHLIDLWLGTSQDSIQIIIFCDRQATKKKMETIAILHQEKLFYIFLNCNLILLNLIFWKHLNIPENIDIVNSGLNCAICFDKNRCDLQYALLRSASSVPTFSSSVKKPKIKKKKNLYKKDKWKMKK